MTMYYILNLIQETSLTLTSCAITSLTDMHFLVAGLLPDNNALDQVLRRHKTRGAVRAIIVMTTLVQSIQAPKAIRQAAYSAKRRGSVMMNLPTGTTQDEIHEIGDVFDMYDTDKSGQ
jgi:hypothetical protein